jgi:hypothetical protein
MCPLSSNMPAKAGIHHRRFSMTLYSASRFATDPGFAGMTDRLVPVAPDSQHKDQVGSA